MSDALAIIAAAALTEASPVVATPDNAIVVSIPALDGHGLTAGYERFFPEFRSSLSASGGIRRSASGDFNGLRLGVAGEARCYWRSREGAWLSKLPDGAMAGWFVLARIELAVDRVHDDVSGRSLAPRYELAIASGVGYRIVPWRQLEITPSVSVGGRHEFARGPDWTRGTIGLGLTAGWLF